MRRSVRIVASAIFALMILSPAAFAAPVGPELDPGSTAAGLTILAAGGLYLVERFRRR